MVRDARGVIHDMGPARTFCPSQMKMIAYDSTGSGRWQTHAGLFDTPKPVRQPQTPEDRRAYNRGHRAANLDHYRELERASSQRYRERKHGHEGQHCVKTGGPRSRCALRTR